MKKSAILLIVILVVFSCKKDEIPVTTPKLKNCRVEYLFFSDDILMKNYQEFILLPMD